MKRLLVMFLLCGAVVVGTGSPASAYEWQGPCSGWRYGEVHPTTARMRALVECVFTRVAPSQTSMALYVAGRESGFNPNAYNPSGCAGIFQHMSRYWDGRVDTFLDRPWFRRWWGEWRPSVYDPRANIWVAALMVRSGGWGPWSTARVMRT